MNSTTTMVMPRAVTVRSVLLGGLVAGLLDILDAMIFWGFYRDVSPIRILQSIASGLLGREAFAGGAATALLGTALHFFIACCAALAYGAASLRFPALVRNPFAGGIAFGLTWYVFMYYLVLPLSAFPGSGPTTILLLANNLFAHIVLFGLPIAFFTRRAFGGRT
jgi:hypothetical protein